MPTPVSAARQCLTDEAAGALDDAVAVARRRSHTQTTSLHAISALLSLPSAALRDACGRARSISYSPGLQFHALKLSVGISLDRLPTTTAAKSSSSAASSAASGDGPPVSNSLMAAIKRSQANQRRNPENFHFMILQQQQNQNNQAVPQTTSFLKVELKYFILSILDDPIVSRVFAEAGFRSYDIKLALLHPPIQTNNNNRFFYSRMNRPVFLCNFEPGGPGVGLPFVGSDQNCRRIVDVLVRKERRNPLLMGVYAKGALKGFMEFVEKGKVGILPHELSGLSVVCVEKEISEFVLGNGVMSEEMMGLRLKDLGCLVEQCLGAGVVVNFGEVEVLVRDEINSVNSVGFVVEQLRRLLENHGGKLWLVGVAGTSEAYSKFLGLFPTVDRDWDLHPLTVTSSSSATSSSLMGSFVPLGGFFSTPSEFRSTLSCTNSSLTRCDTCNQKYEQEVANILKVGPASSACGYSTSLPRLQKVNVDTDKGLDLAKTNEDNTSFNAKIFGLQRKWNDTCQRVHHKRSLPEFDISPTRSKAAPLEGFPFGSSFNESTSKGLSLNGIQYSNQISHMSKQFQSSTSPSKPIVPYSSAPFDAVGINTEIDQEPKVSNIQRSDMASTWLSPPPKANKNVTTDLGLGTIYTSHAHEPDTPKLHDHRRHLQHLSDSLSTDFDAVNESTTHQIAISSPCSGPNFEGKLDSVDFKSLHKLLTKRVGWQDEAINAINRAISLCRSGTGRRSGSRVRADIWLAFVGPDRLGKRKIGSALAESLFGSKESLISVDLSSSESFYPSNSIFEFQSPYCHDLLRRKTVVDYIAGELSKKPHSVIFIENVDKADFLVQNSLFKAIRTGRFPYSLGREISINNAIFIVTSAVFYGRGAFVPEEEPKMFTEERILEAKRCQLQLLLGHASKDAKRIGSTNVEVALRKGSSKPTFLSKRKLVQSSDSKEKATCKTQKVVKEASRSGLDLNLPLEEAEECINDNDCESESEVENYEAWLHEFCDQIDEKVVFKQFNFDSLAEQVMKSIDIHFQRTFGSELVLEIEYEAMAQILAAAWLSDKKNAVEDWVESVLGRGFVEAKLKYHPEAQLVIKLVKCESNFVEEQALGVCLPSRINLD